MHAAAAEEDGRPAELGEDGVDGPGERVEIVGAAVGQPLLGELVPALDGVELARVGGQGYHVEPGIAALHGVHRRAPMLRPVIPEHDDVSAEVPQQGAEEGRDVALPNVGPLACPVEAEPAATHAPPLWWENYCLTTRQVDYSE